MVSIATVVSPNGGKPNTSTSNSLGLGDVTAHLTPQQKPNGGKSKRPNSNYIGPVDMGAHLSNFQPAPPPATKTQPACVQAHPSSSASKSPQWKSLFDEKNIIRDLHFIQPQEPSSFNPRRVKLGEDDHRDVSSWENSLVGFFIGKRPKKEMVEEALNRAWRQDVSFHSLKHGFYLFKFKSYEVSQKILEEGPWFFRGHPLILKRWSEDMNFQREELHSMPIWVKFPNLKMSYRSVTGLSAVWAFPRVWITKQWLIPGRPLFVSWWRSRLELIYQTQFQLIVEEVSLSRKLNTIGSQMLALTAKFSITPAGFVHSSSSLW